MQKIVYKSILAAVAAAVLLGCKPDLKAPDASGGSLDLSKYVAIGNSITSGFADNALYYDGQMVSYPNLIAEQFKKVGGGEFKQPLVGMTSVGVGSSGNSRLSLGYKTDCKGVSALAPVGTTGDFLIFNGIASEGPFNNMGVPGAKAITVVFPGYGNPANGFGNFNPFFTRMLSANEYSTASMLSKAAAQAPTFFSLFIGNNDVLGYASGGGTSDVITPSAGPVGVGFDASIDLIVNTMISSGASKGVIANIPDITSLPYFTTVPYNGLTLTAAQAAGLNAAYAALGITFTEGANAFMIQDAAAPGGVRKIKTGELVLLSIPQDSLKCAGWGSSKPIANKYVLTAAEIGTIQSAVSAYNSKIKAVADAKGLAYVDVNAFMAQTKTGIVYNGVSTSAVFVSGGAFSLDGVHLTPKGNAFLANEFLKAINAKYGSTIPLLNPGEYKGVTFPN